MDSMVCEWYLPAIEWVKIVMTMFGFLGNGFTFFIIVKKKDLHNKTFAVIAAIAISDCIYCFGMILWAFFYYPYMSTDDFRNKFACVRVFQQIKVVLSPTMSAAYMASGFFIAVLSVFRYIILSFPLKANILLTRGRALLTMAAVCTVSVGMAIFKSLNTNIGDKINKPLDFLVSYLLPLIVMVVFHTLKLMHLKRNTFKKTSSSVRKMEIVVAMILSAFFFLLLPWHVLAMLHAFRLYSPNYAAMTVSSLLLLLNNCINPVFYAFLSPRVRRYLCCRCARTKRDSINKAETQSSIAPTCSTIQPKS
jgi:hypothetical protein